ncbi:unnamed protein product [Thlaspi arvense]|uniref:Legume lectin domain-containing protein n=1 Tax=Thlaspi arvense TaxID=13288 RepID=A0AAU9SU07_THLAR|nr:unnamed protein product [Thlaspi arvense]
MLVKLLTIVFFLSPLSQSLKSSSQNLGFTFNGFRPPVTDLSMQGIASITHKGLLKLTKYTARKTSHAFYTKPIRFKDSPNDSVSSFSTTFVFAIQSLLTEYGGEGMAFVVAPNFGLPITSAGQYLGLFNIINNGNDTHHVLAVEFDTNQDTDDPDDNHVGIDINSLKSVKTSPAGYWEDKDKFKKLKLIDGKRMQADAHQISVTMAPFKQDKPKEPLVSIVRDLSSVFLQHMGKLRRWPYRTFQSWSPCMDSR